VVDLIGGFDAGFPAIEDYEFFLRASRFFAFDFVDAALARYANPSGDPAQDARRVSRNFAANMAARRMLFARYGSEMRREGVDHLFLLDDARRYLEAAPASRIAALRSLGRAVRRRPDAYAVYAWLPFALLPWRLRASARERYALFRHPLHRIDRQPAELRVAERRAA